MFSQAEGKRCGLIRQSGVAFSRSRFSLAGCRVNVIFMGADFANRSLLEDGPFEDGDLVKVALLTGDVDYGRMKLDETLIGKGNSSANKYADCANCSVFRVPETRHSCIPHAVVIAEC